MGVGTSLCSCLFASFLLRSGVVARFLFVVLFGGIASHLSGNVSASDLLHEILNDAIRLVTRLAYRVGLSLLLAVQTHMLRMRQRLRQREWAWL